jgi:hypothetical protein
MAQNLVSIAFSDAEIAEIRTHTAALLGLLKPKTVALDPAVRRELFKGGARSELFIRQTVDGLDRNRHLVPAGFALDETLADLHARDIVRPVLHELEQLVERLRDTEMALGSDLMEASVQGYGLLKVLGQNQGLDGLVKELGGRFARRKAASAPTDTPAMA